MFQPPIPDYPVSICMLVPKINTAKQSFRRILRYYLASLKLLIGIIMNDHL